MAEQRTVVLVTSVAPCVEHALTVVQDVAVVVIDPEMTSVAVHLGTPDDLHVLALDALVVFLSDSLGSWGFLSGSV